MCCAMHIVQCTLHIRCAVYTANCTNYLMRLTTETLIAHTLFSVHCKLYKLSNETNNGDFNCTYAVQCTLQIVQTI